MINVLRGAVLFDFSDIQLEAKTLEHSIVILPLSKSFTTPKLMFVCFCITAFDLTQDSGVVDQYGAKKMLQIFNMNPTTEDVTRRYVEHDKDGSYK